MWYTATVGDKRKSNLHVCFWFLNGSKFAIIILDLLFRVGENIWKEKKNQTNNNNNKTKKVLISNVFLLSHSSFYCSWYIQCWWRDMENSLIAHWYFKISTSFTDSWCRFVKDVMVHLLTAAVTFPVDGDISATNNHDNWTILILLWMIKRCLDFFFMCTLFFVISSLSYFFFHDLHQYLW